MSSWQPFLVEHGEEASALDFHLLRDDSVLDTPPRMNGNSDLKCPVCTQTFPKRPPGYNHYPTNSNSPTSCCSHGGRTVFCSATCPICLEESDPIIALPCGHVLCPDDFQQLGGSIRTATTVGNQSTRNRRREEVEEEEEEEVSNRNHHRTTSREISISLTPQRQEIEARPYELQDALIPVADGTVSRWRPRPFAEEQRQTQGILMNRLPQALLNRLDDPDVVRRRREIAMDFLQQQQERDEDEHNYDNLPDLLPYNSLEEEQVQQQQQVQVQTTQEEEEPATPMEGARRRTTNFSAHLVSPEDFNDYNFLTSSSWQPQQQHLSPNAFTTPREEELLNQNDTTSTRQSPTLQRQSGDAEGMSPSFTREDDDWRRVMNIPNNVLPMMQQRQQGVPERLTADILDRRRRLEQDAHRRQQVVGDVLLQEEEPPPNNTNAQVATADNPPPNLYTLNFGRSVLFEDDSSIEEESQEERAEFRAEDEI